MTVYYTATGAPAAATKGLSASIRSEFELIEAAFAALSPAGGTAVSIPYTFSTATTVADPGTGTLRLNQATQNTATAVLADLSDANSIDVTNVLALFDDSTSTVKGFLRIVKLGDATDWLLFSVASMSSPSGYRNIVVTNVASSAASPFADGDDILIEFARTGDKGSSSDTVLYSARTANTALGASDKGNFIDVTSGTFSQTFVTAATLGAGWWCYIRNSGTGDITLDPSGSEEIDGLTSFIMYPGEARLIQCDGSALRSLVLQSFTKTYTASGDFVRPPGYSTFGGLAWSGGASGQRTNNTAATSRGGGGGGCFPFSLKASALAATETVTVGAGGAGVTGVANGNPGGNTSFGAWLKVYGQSGAMFQGGGIGLTAAIIDIATQSSPSFGPANNSTSYGDAVYGGGGAPSNASTVSGASLYGGGAGGGVDAAGVLRAAGSSVHGGAGGAASVAGDGTAGTAPGGGGGATQTGTTSGAGARGELRIYGIA